MTGWNLPPGCTQADIDRAMGQDDVRCQGCGEEVESTQELEDYYIRGRVRWLCRICGEAWARYCEEKYEEEKNEQRE